MKIARDELQSQVTGLAQNLVQGAQLCRGNHRLLICSVCMGTQCKEGAVD